MYDRTTDAENLRRRPVAVVTGATGGIGREIALGLARAGRHVVLVGRDAGRTRAVRARIAAQIPSAQTEIEVVDLSDLRATREAALRIAVRHTCIELLVNNAGVFEASPVTTPEGHDKVLATNLLSPMVLTEALLPALSAGAPARIVNIGSSSSDRARIGPAGLVLGRRWTMVRAYGQSKLALMMASFALARRLQGSGVDVNVVHPGLVASGLVRARGPVGWGWRVVGAFGLSAAQGADTPLHVALSDAFEGRSGLYVKRRRPVLPNPQALDAGEVARVWQETRRLIAATPGAG